MCECIIRDVWWNVLEGCLRAILLHSCANLYFVQMWAFSTEMFLHFHPVKKETNDSAVQAQCSEKKPQNLLFLSDAAWCGCVVVGVWSSSGRKTPVVFVASQPALTERWSNFLSLLGKLWSFDWSMNMNLSLLLYECENRVCCVCVNVCVFRRRRVNSHSQWCSCRKIKIILHHVFQILRFLCRNVAYSPSPVCTVNRTGCLLVCSLLTVCCSFLAQ